MPDFEVAPSTGSVREASLREEIIALSARSRQELPERLRALRRSPPLARGERRDRKLALALTRLLALPGLRSVESWVPAGRSALDAFRSLASHRNARFPVPDFLWNGLLVPETQAAFLVPLVQHVAEGGSLVRFIRSGRLPVRLTRAECHHLLLSPGHLPFLEGLRRAQAHRLTPDVTEELLATEWGRDLLRPDLEARWSAWIAWLERPEELPPGSIGPLSDFVLGRPEGYSLAGRTAASLQAAMHSWHEELARKRPQPHPDGEAVHRSGLRGATWEEERGELVETWSVVELESYGALHSEGRAMHHCVADYWLRVQRGQVSIWSLGRIHPESRERVLTLEVRHPKGEIVQIRGPCNRRPTAEDLDRVARWAALASLAIASGCVRTQLVSRPGP